MKNIQVYNVWVNGRDIDDLDQHFPIDSNVSRDCWHSDLEKATNDFVNAKVDDDFDAEIYQDAHVAFYSIDINIKKFESMFDLKFNIEDEDVQEMIPYYVDYDFNLVAEKIIKP